jgi:predicted transport protein
LFNGVAPLIALQMQAYKINSEIILIFTKVLDEISRGLVDDDEDAEAAPSDRQYWEKQSTPAMMTVADKLFELAKQNDSKIEPKYNKYYVGFARDGVAFNFAIIRPRKKQLNLEVGLPKSSEIDNLMDSEISNVWDYDSKWRRYRISLKPEDISKKMSFLENVMKRAFVERSE